MATEVKIRIRAFPYYEEVEEAATGRTVRQEHIARLGDVVELSDTDLERAKRFNAIAHEDELTEASGQVEPETSAEELAQWIKREKPTIDEVVNKAEGDPEKASKLLEAENLATGQQPRQGLEDRLLKVINQEEE